MMNQTGLRRIPPDQSSGSGHTLSTPRHPRIKDPILSKRVCFYKSGDPQFSGLRMVINNRTFKTFDALLDSLSKKVPLPFGVRNITTPRGVHAIYTLDELEDGKSYICSDRRKVKPINLALARKKLPPWYHARPATSRRQTVQQARSFPSRNAHRQEPVVVRTPKKLLVFHNGDPTLKHTVVLHKRTTANFESILEYISELMQFHVVKLHTPDGRRVDGLPGLILCSGTVVAAGREPFKSANYTSQKSPAPTQFSNNRKRQRRSKSLNRKKKYRSYHSSKSRNFSLSSERYIVNRIHNSMAGSSYDYPLPTNPTNSVELESIAGTDRAEGQGCLPPAEDDIEKSFRVNQDGSMTVEMKVRLTLKEEETIHWTTTLSRSHVANELNASCLPEPVAEEEICSPALHSVDLEAPASSIDSINKDKTKDNNEDPPSPSNGGFNRSSKKEDNTKVQTTMVSPTRAPTPGYKEIRKKQASVESVKSLTANGIQEGVVGSYSYKEQMENGAMTEEYCVVKQRTTRPVPKPRRLGSVDCSNIKSRNISSFKSSEILQIESSSEEVTETVLHIYEQQMCQDNLLANICAHDIPSYGRPATSETGQYSSNNEFEPEFWRPSTASESISIWKTENMSPTSDFTLSSLKTGATQATNKQQISKSSRGKDKPEQKEVNKEKRKPKAGKKRARRLLTPGKRQKQNSAGGTEKHVKSKTFSSAGYIKRIYGNKSKSPKNTSKPKKRPMQNGDGSVTTQSSQSSDGTIKWNLKIPNVQSPPKENQSETVSSEARRLDISSIEVSQPRGTLTRQTSVHKEKKNENKPCDISNSKTLSSSGTNEYVQKWLEKADINTTSYPDEEGRKSDADIRNQDSESGYNHGLVVIAEDEKSELQPSQILRSDSLRTSVKLRVKCFENQLSNSPGEKTATQREEIAPCNSTTTSTENCTSVAQNNTEGKPLLNGTCCEKNPSPIKISLQKATPYNTISMELLPPPPPPDELEELNAECCMMDLSSVASSPLYRLSSVSSQMSDNHPLSISPTSEKATSPTDHTMETVHSDTHSVLRELQRVPSIKRAPLVSNMSLERQMSLRKASLSKYTVGAEDTTASNTTGDDDSSVLPNGLCSTGTHQKSNSVSDLKNRPSLCTSASPTSITSRERMSSDSISLNETPTPSDAQFVQTKQTKTAQEKSASPKPLVKKVKIITSPSQNRKYQSKKLSFDPSNDSPQLSSHEQHSKKTMSPNITKREPAPAPSPSTERRKMLHKAKMPKRPSPYSQSLDMVSPPVTNKSNKKKLSRNLSTDYASEPENNTKRKTSSRRKRHQTPQSINSSAEQDKTQTTLETNRNDKKKKDQEKSATQTQSLPLHIANQPNMRPVLERICCSINSIRQITQNKHPSSMEKSNSLPDFSSHVASTFGSSSKALLAFLSVMTLNEGLNNSDRDKLNANVSCAEALKMIESLREIADIEDSQKLEASLCNLQRSTSKQLLQSWRGFQELSDKCKSCSLTPNDSQELIVNKAKNDYSIEEKVIDRIIDNLDIPKKLKEELMSLSENVDKENMSTRFIEKDELSQKENRDSKISHYSRKDVMNVGIVTQDEKTNVDVSSMIKKFAIVNEPKQSDMHNIALRTETLKHKPPAEVKDKQVTEKTQHRSHNEDKVSQETANMNRVIACRKLQVQSEGSMSIPESGHITDEESGADEEGRNVSSASKDGESRKQSLCSSDAGEDHSHSEEEEQTQQSSNYYVELNVRKESVSSPDSQNQRLSVEEQPEEPQIQNPRQRLKVSVDESVGNSDADEPTTSDEEQLEFERNELKVRSEESLSGIEEEKESIGEEDPLNDLPDPEEVRCNKLQALIREAKEISSEDEDPKKDNSSLLNSDSLAERERFSADEHGSCEEQVEMEQIRSSIEEELSFCEKESSSEKEERLETPVAMDKKVVEKVKLPSEEIVSQSIAERINLLEKQVADAQKRKNVAESPALKRAPQRNVHLESDSEDSPSESPFTRSAPQSSLSFSYDSGGVITTEPEGNRVRYIREMFLAKGSTDNRQRLQRFQSPNALELSELRADTSASGGYQSQTSNEMSGGEDDSARKSITKGFVRRTIERLYGKKDPEEKASERPPSAPKQKKKELSCIFSPFHSARTKATTELSYFNSTNALDSLTEATRCIAFNAQVGPGDSVPIDNGLLRENTPIRKSVSEPVAINKTLTNTPPGEEMCEDTEQNAPNSFYSTTSELEDKTKSLSRKCTYFSLPHASDSDACQDDMRPASKSSVSSEVIAKDTSEDAKTWGERNGILPAGGLTDFRMMDNKVHPLTEVPSDGEVVVVQPRRGQGVMDRRLQEPDVLDLLYNFCGEHCPIL